MNRTCFLSLPSWSISYDGIPFDDARQGRDGIWRYRDIVTREIRTFARQDRLTVICENLGYPPDERESRSSHSG
jgi:hypothetical protein